MFDKPIAISLSPNTEPDDVRLAIKELLIFNGWYASAKITALESTLNDYFGDGFKSLAVNSGRSALYLILETLGIGGGDEVIIQAFTCVAVPNSVLWCGAKPVYTDVDDNYNLDVNTLEKKINKNTKAIVVQHTFGLPARIEEIKKIAVKHKLHLIEDCAHCLGGTYKGRKLGTFGDIAFLSFGRDKVLSAVFGGAVITRNDKIFNLITAKIERLKFPSRFWVLQQQLHPILFSLLLPVYNLGIGKFTLGKFLLFFFQRIKLLSLPVYEKEKSGGKIDLFPRKMPGSLASLAKHQFTKLNRYNRHRREIARLYFDGLKGTKVITPNYDKNSVWLRYPVRLDKAGELFEYAKARGMLLGRWYKSVIEPAKDLSVVGYELGSCPNAEKLARTVLNLPTYPGLNGTDVQKVIAMIKKWSITK
ncbi:MAG: DegT/DnrJ/eryc1/StrS aminotransferase [uncultured bacterium]|uniref:DegT/DnrJ/EryC1/StrS aminotransferase n=1 Tax=Candidatus Woesebacteria bacterium RIFCSPHIGHO2_12_FULL_41_24 TaxID=1802510 RepID=A0A1F8AQ13_9BACT|nr:MAG: DegT/DnrJ/eryc1/StrS aminotransferase [uncultured bacterium]OGM30667.1 MAG: hypothetical protein A2873_00955 [Candidatus Woesebacteria bacterium RIFCSPHIGHO2_01_FULL_42_80]OGM35804.1 MAG: hypothetical protein A3D84_00835 [Candidatus Woesebacteria bacterium RIFCSPHIGHO2_02_FULL_42_20]OGM53863.1 MAG: hypothetical protein A3E44_05605 [Candidatus Woesebacteria bacterium RIFCSPHIGHO2_12_FULL_41_24]OGM66055.1 MAG: hypothetical protein A2969_03700 [Candidatus Woesebacteria bacterium RIFCSPLOWO